MRCRVCGRELEAQDKLRNGAYCCPECGTIHHTASSSRKSPSPWRKHRSGLVQPENVFLRKFFGLPLWSWLAAVLVVAAVVVIVVVFFVRTPGKGGDAAPEGSAESTEMPVVQDEQIGDETVQSLSTESPASTPDSGAQILIPSGDSASTAAGKTTGVALNDFVVSFDWAMNYLKYTGSLTESGQASGNVRSYSYGDWVDVQLALDASGSVITGATVTARLTDGSTDTVPVQAAFVSAFYALDNGTNANSARAEVEKMLADSTLAYGKNNFTAKVTSAIAGSYVMDVQGTL